MKKREKPKIRRPKERKKTVKTLCSFVFFVFISFVFCENFHASNGGNRSREEVKQDREEKGIGFKFLLKFQDTRNELRTANKIKNDIK